MSDSQEIGSDNEAISNDEAASIFYGDESEPEQPTEDTEEEEQESEEVEDEEAGDGESESEAEEDEGELVVDKKNPFVKYEVDEEKGLYKFKSNGAKVSVNVEELINNYQANQKLTSELEKISKERKGIYDPLKLKEVEQVKEQKTLLSEKLTQLDQLIQDADEKVNWEELREYDQVEYLLQKEKQEERKKLKREVEETTKAEREKLQAQTVHEEGQKLREAVGSDWENEETQKADLDSMVNYVKDIGISNEEMNKISDHRFWLAVRDAAKYREMNTKTFEHKKTPPKSVKSKTRAKPKSDEELTDAELFYGKGYK